MLYYTTRITAEDGKGGEEEVVSLMTPKLVREVEREIAENTKKFDESNTSIKSSTTDTKSNASETKLVKKKNALVKSVPPLQAFQVMQLIRLIVIAIVAVATGISLYPLLNLLCIYIYKSSH